MNQLMELINSHDHSVGPANAPLELVEYGDYECPHCGHAYPIIKEIQQRLGDELRFVFRNFPLARIHPNAFAAAVATEAAALQGKFWEMHDLIFEHQRALDNDNILLLAASLGLDAEQFETDIHKQSLSDKVETDFESGIRSGVNGTPTFFINGKKYEGEWLGSQLLEYLQKELRLEVSAGDE